ncbi:MAG: DUF1361 domain-containing protein [Erysipelotrichaceae bacterium]|nr:DUF1361 domain-containing protein [Erysipelotrichaceae bacterium]MDY5251690.1 DUF1361 domain-containing protein [Erysipelotrichaceae bacterium]
MTKKDLKLTFLLIFISFIYAFCGVVLDRMGVDIKLRWLFWNEFLAFLPLVLSIPAAYFFYLRKGWIIIGLIFGVGWLLFLPNACYMITDLIHLDSSQLIGWNGEYIANLREWVALIYLAAGIFLAVVAGLASTKIIAKSVGLKRGNFLNLLYNFIISGLVGYGVYIGRFLRFNTWDILEPLNLLKSLYHDFDRFAFMFSILIAGFYFIAYMIYERVEETSK